MSFLVELTNKAQLEIDVTYSWIKERSFQGANRWYNKLSESLRSLELSNSIPGSLAPESDYLSESIRQVLFKTKRGNIYRILFIVQSNTISVLSVRGAGRDWLKPEELI